MTDYSELLALLRKVEGTKPDCIGIRTQWHRNPEGPQAARAIETLTRELGEAKIGLENYDKTMMAIANAASDDAAQLVTLRDELTDTKARLAEAVEVIHALRKDIDDLVGNSTGVAGLHMNGDVADWDSLLPGGCFGAWLGSVEQADDFLAKQEPKP